MQINGVVWSQVVVGNTVYVAGKFTPPGRPARPPAPGDRAQQPAGLRHPDRRADHLLRAEPQRARRWRRSRPRPDGSRIYVGGDFTLADGQARNRIAAYSTATGQLVADFRPAFNGQVAALAATNTTVYVGGCVQRRRHGRRAAAWPRSPPPTARCCPGRPVA